VQIQAPDNPSTHKKMPLILFFHGYSADSQYATEHFHLDALNLHNYVVMALNGRQVCSLSRRI
jgi:cephalosporin-C deacetylase-like acetyl esterase